MMFSTNNTSPVVQVLNPCERLRHEFHHDPAVLTLSELDVLFEARGRHEIARGVAMTASAVATSYNIRSSIIGHIIPHHFMPAPP